ncbi:hypothetical protein [Luteibacter sp. E-22]|uniref:hypothetical protein n=1 Tax=Luteibacter sp. E-22 TaxID=3404050 RepID=UPI003CFB5C6B
MNARPYIFGCLCLVGAAGTAAASDIDPTSGLLSMGSTSSSSFEGSSRSPQGGGRDGVGNEIGSSRPVNAPQRSASPAPVPSSPVDAGDGVHDDGMPMRSSSPSWQSLLPGSMF